MTPKERAEKNNRDFFRNTEKNHPYPLEVDGSEEAVEKIIVGLGFPEQNYSKVYVYASKHIGKVKDKLAELKREGIIIPGILIYEIGSDILRGYKIPLERVEIFSDETETSFDDHNPRGSFDGLVNKIKIFGKETIEDLDEED